MAEIYDPRKPFNGQIREIITQTHPTEGPLLVRPSGKRFSVEIDSTFAMQYRFLAGTDGIGTKALLHWLMGTPEKGVRDAAAMTFDDLYERGFTPMYLQDHLVIQEENPEIMFKIMDEMRDVCVENAWSVKGRREMYPVAITGGETAILNTIKGYELGLTVTGFVKKGEEIEHTARAGDELIGIASSGLHSNGYSFVRDELLEKRKMNLDDKLPWNKTLGEELTIPTHIYLSALKELVNDFPEAVRGMVHITGGGLSKLAELSESKDVDFNVGNTHGLRPQDIFFYLNELNSSPEEKMYTRFNNGIGYVIAVKKGTSRAVLRTLRQYFDADVIGEVTKGTGKVRIKSHYSNKELVY